ncbi:MAG: GtrA family protein [Candidatus Paceibacteria bacterium]
MRVLKFFISGVIGISINLGVFHVLYVLGIPYLMGSVAGVLTAVIIGFVLQKYWTFEDRPSGRTHEQFALYAALAFANLLLNTGIVYLLIGTLGVNYLLAQTVGAAFIAIDSFVVYHFFIFSPV